MSMWHEMFSRLEVSVDESMDRNPCTSFFIAWDTLGIINQDLWRLVHSELPPTNETEKKELEDLLESLAVEAIKALYFTKKYEVNK